MNWPKGRYKDEIGHILAKITQNKANIGHFNPFSTKNSTFLTKNTRFLWKMQDSKWKIEDSFQFWKILFHSIPWILEDLGKKERSIFLNFITFQPKIKDSIRQNNRSCCCKEDLYWLILNKFPTFCTLLAHKTSFHSFHQIITHSVRPFCNNLRKNKNKFIDYKVNPFIIWGSSSTWMKVRFYWTSTNISLGL